MHNLANLVLKIVGVDYSYTLTVFSNTVYSNTPTYMHIGHCNVREMHSLHEYHDSFNQVWLLQ